MIRYTNNMELKKQNEERRIWGLKNKTQKDNENEMQRKALAACSACRGSYSRGEIQSCTSCSTMYMYVIGPSGLLRVWLDYTRFIFQKYLVHKNHTSKYLWYERVWCTTQLAKLSFNHSRLYSQLMFFNFLQKKIWRTTQSTCTRDSRHTRPNLPRVLYLKPVPAYSVQGKARTVASRKRYLVHKYVCTIIEQKTHNS